ncbi:cAMP responsive element-binding protein isoform X3 [Aplysia californica]|nr:cAMP responsive element-binding protein isoform X3 [Aplysia californica]XP_012939803.1 cAMP responsive element-binding protein isoform X3 [Aplysia californica]XP_035826478.1 cAMP responsive element-binding protein isoform X3 [Aplysia californica]
MSEGSGPGTADLENGNQGISMVHVSIPNQGIQVQPVIQANQQSVIQSAGNLQTIQVVRVAAVDEDLSSSDSDAKKRREILTRRPSYRKILNELSSPVSKMDDDSNSSQSQDGHDSYVQTNALQLTAHGDATPATQGLQTLTMTNASPTSASNSTGGTTIVQYAQGPDGQFYIPVGGTNVQAYQITAPGSLAQGVVMTSGSPIASPQHMSEEGSRKRELRLLKNREAARECRRKKKEYVKCLENRVAVLENQNKTLIEELKALKELYCQKDA